jgi:hypothetical protein
MIQSWGSFDGPTSMQNATGQRLYKPLNEKDLAFRRDGDVQLSGPSRIALRRQ